MQNGGTEGAPRGDGPSLKIVVYGGYEKFSGLFLSALGTAALADRKETPS